MLWLTLESLADLERLSTSSETLDLRGLASGPPLVLRDSVLAGESASSSQPWYRLKSDLSLSSLCPFSVSWPWGQGLTTFPHIFSACALLTCIDMGSPSAGLASYTVFIFIKPSRAAVSWEILAVNSSILDWSFFLRWLGGSSEKSSWIAGTETF